MSAPREVIWLDGQVLPSVEARVSALDRGLLYGDGVFETVRVYGSRPFRLAAHLGRLQAGASSLQITLPLPADALAQAVHDTLAAGGLEDAYLRITLTRGVGGLPGDLAASPRATLLIHARPYAGYAPELYQRGLRATVAATRRNETSPLSRIKSLNYLDNVLCRAQAGEQGYDDALMLNTAGRVAETTCANLFLVRGGQVLTPPVSDGILPGITRAVIMELAAVSEQSFTPAELYAAEEAFLTNSLMEVAPLVEVATRRIGSGSPGPVTLALHRKYRGLVRAG